MTLDALRFTSPPTDVRFADDSDEEDTRRQRRPKALRSAAAEARRVLVVEDEWFVAVENEAALRDAKFDVVGVAMSSEEALTLTEAKRPDLVLMDIRLPGQLDGIELAMLIRARFDIPSLFVTAHSDPAMRERGEAARPRGWLIKPFSSAQLVKAVEAALGGRE